MFYYQHKKRIVKPQIEGKMGKLPERLLELKLFPLAQPIQCHKSQHGEGSDDGAAQVWRTHPDEVGQDTGGKGTNRHAQVPGEAK